MGHTKNITEGMPHPFLCRARVLTSNLICIVETKRGDYEEPSGLGHTVREAEWSWQSAADPRTTTLPTHRHPRRVTCKCVRLVDLSAEGLLPTCPPHIGLKHFWHSISLKSLNCHILTENFTVKSELTYFDIEFSEKSELTYFDTYYFSEKSLHRALASTGLASPPLRNPGSATASESMTASPPRPPLG